MAMTKCKECKQEVSTTANKCPNCGVSNPGVPNKAALKGCGIMLLLFFAFVWFFVPSDDAPLDYGVSVDYTILSDESRRQIRRSVEVLLPQRISEEQLEAIAREIYAMKSPSPERTFIGHRIFGGDPESLYWATTHFDPELQVRVQGMSIEEYEYLTSIDVSEQFPGAIGSWLVDRGFSYLVIIHGPDDDLVVTEIHSDGSTADRKYQFSTDQQGGIRFETEDNDFGEYFTIDADQNLRFWGESGNYYSTPALYWAGENT